MKIEQVAAITWTIRETCKTAEDFRISMQKLADIGYKAVQVSSRPPVELMSNAEVVEACQTAGLTICATHENADAILNNTETAIQNLKELSCTYTAYPFPANLDLGDVDVLKDFCDKLDKAGAAFREEGLVLTYHNHAIEFQKVAGKTILDTIYDETDPSNLQGEIDTYWVQSGGGNPVEWCQKLNNRLPLLHMKDLGVYSGNESTMTEIGAGNLDFKAILKVAESAGCQWFIVEQDECPGDPFESLKQSFDYIRVNLVV